MDDWEPRPAIFPSEWLQEQAPMNDTRYYSLIELKAAADDACHAAFKMREEIDGAVNWANLVCYDARGWTSYAGDRGYTVMIEEASPDAADLHRFVEHFLHERGFDGVEVVTEW